MPQCNHRVVGKVATRELVGDVALPPQAPRQLVGKTEYTPVPPSTPPRDETSPKK